jgi:hypothetical protein
MKTLRGFISILGITFVLALGAAAQVNLTSLDGNRVNVEGQTGKVVVLAVGASWLPLSRKQADYTNALIKKYAGRDVVFYFVATDSADPKSKNYASTETLRKFGMDNKLGIPILRDTDGAVTLRRYSIEQVPSFVILNKSGAQAGEPFGGIDPKYDITIPISKAIDKLL